MPEPKKGPRLGGSSEHQKAMLSNLARDVIMYGRITTTQSRARLAQPLVERLITYAKKGDLDSRRMALEIIGDRDVINRLFVEIAPRYRDRDGGYSRILKLGVRQGDGARMVTLELT